MTLHFPSKITPGQPRRAWPRVPAFWRSPLGPRWPLHVAGAGVAPGRRMAGKQRPETSGSKRIEFPDATELAELF